MSNVYVTNRIIGSSTTSVEDAIGTAVATAGRSLRNLEWFEVQEIRGHIEDNKVAHFQVTMLLGARYDSGEVADEQAERPVVLEAATGNATREMDWRMARR